MGIYNIGVDLVAIDRITTLLQKYGDKFARRILCHQEFEDWKKRVSTLQCTHSRAAKLAKYWATKEATSKAFGTGFAQGIRWRDIGLNYDAQGKPSLYFQGRAKTWTMKHMITQSHISLSDECGMVIAMVTLENGSI